MCHMIGRPVEVGNLTRARLIEFKLYKAMVDDKKEPESMPELSKLYTIAKFLDEFPTHVSDLNGVSGVVLSYLIRETAAVPAELLTLISLRTWSGDNTSMMDELIDYTPHTEPACMTDNARVYALLSEALVETSAIFSISKYQQTHNGPKASSSLVTHNLGSSKWEKTVDIAEGVLNSRIWNGTNSRYPIKIHIARHREAFNDLERACEHITHTLPMKLLVYNTS